MTTQSTSVRLLYLLRGPVPPPSIESHDRFFCLSSICGGDILQPVWWRNSKEAKEKLGAFPRLRRGRFTYHMFLAWRLPAFMRATATLCYFVWQGWTLSRREGPYDAVMSYGTNTTGVAALAIARLTGAKLIVEIPGVPEDAYLFQGPRLHWLDRLKRVVAGRTLELVVSRADRAKLLYPTQLREFAALRAVPTSTFHDFVPLAGLDPEAPHEQYALLVGHPWYTKGVDLLIEAFVRIAPEVPTYSLKVIGHFPDRAHLDDLAGSNERVEILPPVKHPVAMAAISRCSLFVLPSRTEAMGRVLLEAMAAGKPIVASRVGGIPHYVQEGENGFLFDSGSVSELAQRMLDVLRDPALARRLGKHGRHLARSRFNEEAYVRCFADMLRATGLPAGDSLAESGVPER